MTTAIIYSDEWRQFDYGREHPLRMERLGLTWRLMEAYGLTALPRAKVLAPEAAQLEQIARFHAREYLEILRAVSAGDWVPHAARYGLGPGDNPIFPGLWEAAQLAAGGSLLAAPPGSATSTTRYWPSCTCASGGSGWPTWTSTPTTATACSSPSTRIRPSSRSPPTSAATGSFPAPASWSRWARATG